MFVRVREFGGSRREMFPAASVAGKLFAGVGAAGEALEQQLSSNPGVRGTPREGTTSKAIARQALRRSLSTIVTLARALALDTPDIADKFKLPVSCGDDRLLVVARSFVANSRPLAKLFIAHDMPPNFLTVLTEEIDAMCEAMAQGRLGREKARTMRGDIDATIDKGVRAVVKLNAVIRSRLQDDRAALASWDEARRIDYSARTRNGDSTAVALSAPPVPTGPPGAGEPSATTEASASAPQP
jgi:hypothetical protein